MPNDTTTHNAAHNHNTAAVTQHETATDKHEADTKMKFNFRKDDLGERRPAVELLVPTPTKAGLLEALKDEKQTQYILNVISDEIWREAKKQINDDIKPVNTQEDLDLSKLSLRFLANQTPAERRGSAIPKEVWTAFGQDYMAVMPGVTGKSAEACNNAVQLFMKKFAQCKSNKDVLNILKGQLAIYVSNTPNLEDFQEIVTLLDEKLTAYLATDEVALLQSL